jgi:hypothetical protein
MMGYTPDHRRQLCRCALAGEWWKSDRNFGVDNSRPEFGKCLHSCMSYPADLTARGMPNRWALIPYRGASSMAPSAVADRAVLCDCQLDAWPLALYDDAAGVPHRRDHSAVAPAEHLRSLGRSDRVKMRSEVPLMELHLQRRAETDGTGAHEVVSRQVPGRRRWYSLGDISPPPTHKSDRREGDRL